MQDTEKIISDPSEQLIEETIAVKRCALVVKGGRRFSFSAYVVVGNGLGVVGLGHGKAGEVSSAIMKAGSNARKNLFRIEKEERTIPHEALGHFGASKILLMPACPGTGVIACTPVRALMQAAGISDILTKSFKSNNPVNLIKAAMDGLQQLRTRKTLESLRGVKII